jgi:hypothetical protein
VVLILSRTINLLRGWAIAGAADLLMLRPAVPLLFDLGSPLLSLLMEVRKDIAEEFKEVKEPVLLVEEAGREIDALIEPDVLGRGVVVLEGTTELT